MAGLKIRSFMIFWALLLALVLFGHNVSHAEKREDVKWTLDFKDVSISDALVQLTRATGIKLITTKTIAHKITKSYSYRGTVYHPRDPVRHLHCGGCLTTII